jgi:hypothetical protein
MYQAARNIDPDSASIYAALCCTHFGYCQKLIQTSLAGFIKKSVTILNPNRQMAAYLPSKCRRIPFSRTTIDIQVVSKIFWEDRKINSISRLIRSVSPETADALKNYTQVSDLFD